MKKLFAAYRSQAIRGMLALVCLATPVLTGHAAPWVYPTDGPWDCITSGAGQDGITFLNFTTDPSSNGLYSFTGYFLVAGQKKGGGTNPRGGGSGSRGESSPESSPIINFYGGGNIAGEWFFDSKGRVAGSYFTVVNATGSQTNYLETCIDTNITLTITNSDGAAFLQPYTVSMCFTNGPTLSTNIAWQVFSPDNTLNAGSTNLLFVNDNSTVTLNGTTNNISFVGTVVPGKRLTLVASSTFGKLTFKGVPLVQTTFLDGSLWAANKIVDRVSYQEFFHMTQSTLPNFYLIDGQGPSYRYNSTADEIGDRSFCLISSQRKIGFHIAEFPFGIGAAQERNTFGSFSNKKTTSAKTKGASEPDLTMPVSFNGTVVSPP